MFRAFFFVLSGVTLCGANQINSGREHSKLKNIFYSAHKREMVTGTLHDQCSKSGSFKIEDGPVIGGGMYEIGDNGIDIDLKLKIKPCGKPATPEQGGTTPSPNASDDEKARFLHNKFRAIHGSPPMILNAEMSKSAAAYAADLARLGDLKHASRSERDGAGENLSYGCSSSKGQTVEEAVTNWYNEVCDPGYTFGSESMGGAGHFTQLVWKSSVELGFGRADIEQNGMKCSYYVARYKSAGNDQGYYAKNVLKGSFDKSYCETVVY